MTKPKHPYPESPPDELDPHVISRATAEGMDEDDEAGSELKTFNYRHPAGDPLGRGGQALSPSDPANGGAIRRALTAGRFRGAQDPSWRSQKPPMPALGGMPNMGGYAMQQSFPGHSALHARPADVSCQYVDLRAAANPDLDAQLTHPVMPDASAEASRMSTKLVAPGSDAPRAGGMGGFKASYVTNVSSYSNSMPGW